MLRVGWKNIPTTQVRVRSRHPQMWSKATPGHLWIWMRSRQLPLTLRPNQQADLRLNNGKKLKKGPKAQGQTPAFQQLTFWSWSSFSRKAYVRRLRTGWCRIIFVRRYYWYLPAITTSTSLELSVVPIFLQRRPAGHRLSPEHVCLQLLTFSGS